MFARFSCLKVWVVNMIGGISTVGASSGVVIPQVPSVPVAPNSASFASTLTSSPPAPGAVDTDDFLLRVLFKIRRQALSLNI